MKKWIFVFMVMLLSQFAKAHQPDLSSIMLIEQNEDLWLVQVRASLTAFEYEIESTFGKESYKTPDEFKALVLKHLKQNLHVNFNERENVILCNGIVKLGHETSIVFEILNFPKLIESVNVQNLSFKEIMNNKSALIVLKKDFEKEQFILSKSNNYEAKLLVGALKFELKPSTFSVSSSSYVLLIICGLGFFGISAFVYFIILPIRFNNKSIEF